MWVFSVQAGGGEVHAEIIMVSVSFRQPVTHLGNVSETFCPSVCARTLCLRTLTTRARVYWPTRPPCPSLAPYNVRPCVSIMVFNHVLVFRSDLLVQQSFFYRFADTVFQAPCKVLTKQSVWFSMPRQLAMQGIRTKFVCV